MGVNEWLDCRDSTPTLLSFLVGSVAVDNLFSTFFECEEFAKDKGGRRSRDDVAGDHAGEDLRGRTGLLQSLVNETGILHQVHVMMCEPLFSADSPLLMLNRSFTGRGARISRGMQLRLSALFRHRFLGTFWSEELAIIRILDEELELQLQRLEALVVPGGKCLKCEGSIIHRLRDRLTAAPVLTREEMLTVVLDMFDAVAEDPLICSMHDVELLHAASRQSGARCIDRRKKLPVALFSSQGLSRWSTAHQSRMGKRFRKPEFVRKKILKQTQRKSAQETGKTRQVSAHNLFVSDAQTRRRFVICFCMNALACMRVCVWCGCDSS